MTDNVQANYLSYKYCEATLEEFLLIYEPLIKHFSVKYFTYFKLFPDASFLHLANDLEWQQYYFQNIYDNTTFLPNEIYLKCPHNNPNLIITLWPLILNSKLTEAAYRFGRNNGLMLTKYSPEYTERWFFSIGGNPIESHIIYINHLDILIKFIDYFSFKAKEIIKTDWKDKSKLGIFKYGVTYESPKFEIEENIHKREFLKEIKFSDNPILTKRETECLYYLTKGETIKEIAIHLHLSPRTVEDYLNNIKSKTGCSRRSELCQLVNNSF